MTVCGKLDKMGRRTLESAPGSKNYDMQGEAMDKQALLKLTVVKLREEALKIPNITGVHGMNKQTLLDILFDHFGIPKDVKVKKDHGVLKKQITTLRTKKEEVRATGDKKQIKKIAKRLHDLKRRTRG
jgi:hypothetical protein